MGHRQFNRPGCHKGLLNPCQVRAAAGVHADDGQSCRRITVDQPLKLLTPVGNGCGAALLLEGVELLEHRLATLDPSLQGDGSLKTGRAAATPEPENTGAGNKQTKTTAGDVQQITEQPLPHQQTAARQGHGPRQPQPCRARLLADELEQRSFQRDEKDCTVS